MAQVGSYDDDEAMVREMVRLGEEGNANEDGQGARRHKLGQPQQRQFANFKRHMRTIRKQCVKEFDTSGTEFVVVMKRPGFDAQQFCIGDTMATCAKSLDPAKQLSSLFDSLKSLPRDMETLFAKNVPSLVNESFPPAAVALKAECEPEMLDELLDPIEGGPFNDRRRELRSIASRLATLVGMNLKLDVVRTELPDGKSVTSKVDFFYIEQQEVQEAGKTTLVNVRVNDRHPHWPPNLAWKPIHSFKIDELRTLIEHLRNHAEDNNLWKVPARHNESAAAHARITVAAPQARAKRGRDEPSDGDDHVEDGDGNQDGNDQRYNAGAAASAPQPPQSTGPPQGPAVAVAVPVVQASGMGLPQGPAVAVAVPVAHASGNGFPWQYTQGSYPLQYTSPPNSHLQMYAQRR